MTLHNQALVNMDTKPSEGFEKLAFLLQQPSFPPVTFGNLLLLYCKHEVHHRPAQRVPGGSQTGTVMALSGLEQGGMFFNLRNTVSNSYVVTKMQS